MRLDEERESRNYEIQSGGGRGGGGGNGGLVNLLLPLVASKFGLVGVAVLVVGGAIMNGGLEQGSGEAPQVQQASAERPLTPEESLSLKVLGSTERVWGDIYASQNARYEPTTLVFYSRNGTSDCGAAQSAMGPFYCPSDKKIYLDTDFYKELQDRFGAPGDFAQAYVIAHEVGHHIQDLQGTLAEVNQAQRQLGGTRANALQVKVELQADCYAGVWGKRTGLMEAGDMEEGLRAAQAIGDDTLQREAGRRPMPDSFTHGRSEERMTWLRRGLESGDPAVCDTFSARR